jgi:hypothetical protein
VVTTASLAATVAAYLNTNWGIGAKPALITTSKTDIGAGVTDYLLVDCGRDEETPADLRRQIYHRVAPFTIKVAAAAEADRDTYVSRIEALLRGNTTVAGGWWEVKAVLQGPQPQLDIPAVARTRNRPSPRCGPV